MKSELICTLNVKAFCVKYVRKITTAGNLQAGETHAMLFNKERRVELKYDYTFLK